MARVRSVSTLLVMLPWAAGLFLVLGPSLEALLGAWLLAVLAPLSPSRLAALLGALVLAFTGGPLIDALGWIGIGERLGDRHRLEAWPAIHPERVFDSHAQRFYIHAPGTERMRLRLGEARWVDALGLGHGLFVAHYDPSADGRAAASDGELVALLEVDGQPEERLMRHVRSRRRPTGLVRWGDAWVAVEEGHDQLLLLQGGRRRSLAVGDGPVAAVPWNGSLLVAYRGGTLERRDGDGQVLARFDARDGSRTLALSPAGRGIALGTGEAVVLVDAESWTEAWRVPLAEVDHLCFLGDGSLAVASRRPALLTLLTPDGQPRARRSLMRPATALACRGDRVALAATDFGAGPPHLGNHFVQDQIVVLGPALEVVAQHRTAHRTPRQGRAGAVDRGVSPLALAWREGQAAAAAAENEAEVGENEICALFAGTREIACFADAAPPRFLELPELLSVPRSFLPDGDGWWVASPTDGVIARVAPGGALTQVHRVALADAPLLRESERALQRRWGERHFYETTRSGVSCQSCHYDADTDGALRNIGGSRLAPTSSVRGIAGTAPYLRDGSYPRLRDLEHLSETLLRGVARPGPDRGRTLEAFIEDLPRRPPPPLDPAQARRGIDAFVGGGCPACHAFPAFTDLGAHSARALFGSAGPAGRLDTPSLLQRSVGPYLADGRAPTLDAIWRDHDPRGRHGNVAALDERARLDLMALLAAL